MSSKSCTELVLRHGRLSVAWLALGAAAFLLSGACAPTALAPSPTAAQRQAGISVEGAWARAASGAGATSAGYLKIHNTGTADDQLIGARSDAAQMVEVHRSSMDNGVMRMSPAGPVPVPAGGDVALEPGGLHIMLMDLPGDLAEGSKIDVTLVFEAAGDVPVQVPVRSAAG